MLLYYPNNTYWKSNFLNHNHPDGKDQEQFNLFWLIENLPKDQIVDVNYLYCDSVYNQPCMIYSCVMAPIENDHWKTFIVWDGQDYFMQPKNNSVGQVN